MRLKLSKMKDGTIYHGSFRHDKTELHHRILYKWITTSMSLRTLWLYASQHKEL